MPSYDARGRELRNALAAIQADLDGGETTRIAAVLADYLNARDAVLTMMQVLLTEDAPEPLADDYAGKLRDMTRSATDKLDNMLSGLSTPSAAAVRFREQASFAEFIFWGQLGTLKVAQARDRLAADAQKVRELVAVLDKKWQNLNEEDLRIEQAEERAAQDLKDLLEQQLAQAMPFWIQVSAVVLDLRDTWKSVFTAITDHVKETLVGAGVPRPLADWLLKAAAWANGQADLLEVGQMLGMPVDDILGWINRIRSMNVGGLVQYRLGTVLDSKTKAALTILDGCAKGLKLLVEDQYYSRMAAFKAALDNEGMIVVAYGGIREQVDKFLKDCNLDGLRAAHEAAAAAMDGLDASLATDGMKSDWSELKRSLKDALLTRRAEAEKAFEQFYRANDGRFIGGLNGDTERALLETDKWIVTTNGIIAVGLDAKLREWRQAATVVQAGPKEAFDQVQDAFLGLPIDLRDSVRSSMNDYLTQQITTLNAEADKAIAVLEKSSLLVNAKKISDDMDRSRLQQALRATIR